MAQTKQQGKELYAIKAIDKSKAVGRKIALMMMQNEIKILRRLNHKYVMKLYEVYENNTCVYFVLEYMPGGTLFQRLQVRGMYAEFEVARMIKCVLEGLAYCHQHNIIHRDIKLENLLIA